MKGASLRQLGGVFALALMPLLFFLPPGFSLLLLGATLARLALLQLPHLALQIPTLTLGAWLLIRQYPAQGLTFSLLALLALVAVAKWLETRAERDAHWLFFLQQLLMMALFTFAQSFWALIWALAVLVLGLWQLLKIHQGEHWQWSARFHPKELARMLLLTLPPALALFIWFPRIEPLWQIPQRGGAVTGLSDTLALGEIAHLVQSDALAFRVRFTETAPPPAQRYWRGPVLERFDGEQWRAGATPTPVRLLSARAILHYRLTTSEKMNWLPVLAWPLQVAPQMSISGVGNIALPPQTAAGRYAITSAQDYALAQSLSLRERRLTTALPRRYPQTQALATRLWHLGGETTAGFIQSFRNYIHREPFFYTLRPPQGASDVETFLFSGRRGFCEHYANAFAIAARSVGIPARIVLGYQGGQFNPFSGELEVRQQDAHAWVELWDGGQGWVRVDPTAWVAPKRIEKGDFEELEGREALALGSRLSLRFAGFLWLRQSLDALSSFWQNWVIDLDAQKQKSLLARLGLGSWAQVGVMLFSAAALLWLTTRHLRSRGGDRIQQGACAVLALAQKLGWQREARESLAAFLRRLGSFYPQERALFEAAASNWEAFRFRGETSEEVVVQTLRQLRWALWRRRLLSWVQK